jgi:hypothetical protein
VARARRALRPPRRRRRVWLLIVIPLVVLLTGTVIILQLSRLAKSGGLPMPDLSSLTQPTESGGATRGGHSTAAAVLRNCHAKVEAGDKVLTVAKQGMRVWSEHIQAQTDANAGKITLHEMDDIFERTRKSGAEDAQRYKTAVDGYRREKGPCTAQSDPSADLREQLARCAQRETAQQPVLRAAEDGMSDWIRHLAEMRRSKQGKIHNPQKKWLQTWRAAPKNINAYDKAAEKYSAPNC